MNIILDIIGATIIGGVIIFMIINLNIYSSQKLFASGQELGLEQNAKTLAEIMDHDLRKVGFNYSGNPIEEMDSTHFTFHSDIDSNGVMDKVGFTCGDTTEMAATPNPNDIVLYRIINSDTSKGPSLGLTKLRFTYNDKHGNKTAYKDSVKYIKAEMWIESAEKTDEGKYLFTYWEMTINPRNL